MNENERIFPIERIWRPVEDLLKNRPISGILLFISVIAALIWSNSQYSESYHDLWKMHFTIGLNDYKIDKSLHHWINDGLMAIFFFVIGLEIKREVMAGELSSVKKAALPAAAAVGGMMIPALIYILFNFNTPAESGWGVPMATDIAFILGVLSLLGNKVPLSLKIFLTALAIVDDLGAVMVIAFFYTENLVILSLEYGLVFLIILLIANRLGIRNSTFYAIIGICGVWIAFLFSGVHATIAGVLLAMTIPSTTKLNRSGFIARVSSLLKKLGETKEKKGDYLSDEQHEIIQEMRGERSKVQPPLQKLEHALNPFVSFIVLPLFALANTGVELNLSVLNSLTSNISLGVMLGLVLGKFLGILSFSFLFVKLKIAELPADLSWEILSGGAVMAGIGFTMSIFISELAFDSSEVREQVKAAILLASVISALIGVFLIQVFSAKKSLR